MLSPPDIIYYSRLHPKCLLTDCTKFREKVCAVCLLTNRQKNVIMEGWCEKPGASTVRARTKKRVTFRSLHPVVENIAFAVKCNFLIFIVQNFQKLSIALFRSIKPQVCATRVTKRIHVRVFKAIPSLSHCDPLLCFCCTYYTTGERGCQPLLTNFCFQLQSTWRQFFPECAWSVRSSLWWHSSNLQ